MVNEEVYFKELQKIIGETKSADMINERWNEVLERLDQLSIEYAKRLQEETGIRYEKNGQPNDIWLFPPYRLLAWNLILSYWTGWLSVPKKLNLASDWERIENAYNNGKKAFTEHERL
jgi:hypothetical protein